LLITELAAALGARRRCMPPPFGRGGAGQCGTACFDSNLGRWLEMGTEQFAIGEESFNFLLHYQHALRDTAPELWRYGLRLKEEIEADLVRLAKRLDGVPWPELVDKLRAIIPLRTSSWMRTRKRWHARATLWNNGNSRPFPRRRWASFPRGLHASRDSVCRLRQPRAYSRDPHRWFYVTVPDSRLPAAQQERILRDHCRYELAATALHEGYPGHHLQLVIAKEQPSHVRKNLWTPLTVEGWALYCEDMMGEQGFYASDQELFFQRVHLLCGHAHSARRRVAHARPDARQAVDQMVSELHVERGNAKPRCGGTAPGRLPALLCRRAARAAPPARRLP